MLLSGGSFYFWALKKCWSSNSDWLPGETMAGWRRPMKGQPWVTVWTWTFFSSPEIKSGENLFLKRSEFWSFGNHFSLNFPNFCLNKICQLLMIQNVNLTLLSNVLKSNHEKHKKTSHGLRQGSNHFTNAFLNNIHYNIARWHSKA